MSKSKPADDRAESKPKSGMMKMVLGAMILLGLGAGGAYGAFAAGLVGPSGGGDHGPDVPQLVSKGAEDPFAPVEDEAVAMVHGEGGSEYRTAYYSFEEGFTSNLKDSPGLVQLSLAASTRHDGRVIQWLQMHELAIRSAILVELANTMEDDVFTVEGKEDLKQRLTAAINRVLEEEEGFGGVDAVHFRTFLVQ
ncbi:flagellar basal body-associated FliL family protein [Aurantiacibacter zhengii]|uniref:Flagellar protein FliL n=1 Tax=Aurantiacibacter zhengii TaxID=2307003 RepID=A0A418NS76_9SPHN|nr:flagellar basal body-associated FliL family protein [Aurantiacibacter zhengii]RIV85792.1 flagellar basal body-associated protein FliL [Aurantiacibacter zhengii]